MIEGWGATVDSEVLYFSDGTSTISIVDPISWTVGRQLNVHTEEGKNVQNINELEYANGQIYENVYQTDFIVKINPDNGLMVTVFYLKELAKTNEKGNDGRNVYYSNVVMNGIAYNSATNTCYLTGKRWNYSFEVTQIQVYPIYEFIEDIVWNEVKQGSKLKFWMQINGCIARC